MLILIPIVIYLCLMLYIAFKVNNIKNEADNFAEEYFIGGRKMGGVVLAMTIVSTYVGASSFIGGPGISYKLGLGWVLLAAIQVPTVFLTLGVLGKKMAIVSRKIKAITILDILKVRYKSDVVVILSAIMMLIFCAGVITAQFVGGARLFESVTGYSYVTGLVIFAFVVIIYTTIGGFKAVAITDAIQGFVMLAATFILFLVILKKGGGMANIMQTVKSVNPDLLRPDSGGNIAKNFIMSFWVLVGVGVLALPATVVRCMAFKDSKSMHNAMIIGTSIVGLLMLGMHFVGVMGVAIEPDIEIGDKIIPILALTNLHPILAGIFIGGPLAAIMSTVDSLLILSASTIIKDLYINYINPKASDIKIKKLSITTSFLVGIIVFALALNPPKLLVWINLFSLAGQEVVFFSPIIFGLFWKKANYVGVILSMTLSTTFYLTLSIMKIDIFGFHHIVPALFLSIILFIIGSLLGPKTDEETLEIFFN